MYADLNDENGYHLRDRELFVSYKRKYVHELLVNRLFKPAHEKSVIR